VAFREATLQDAMGKAPQAAVRNEDRDESPKAEPSLTLNRKEEESIALVERLFKGKLEGFADIPQGVENTEPDL
jgi:hypothetical protein